MSEEPMLLIGYSGKKREYFLEGFIGSMLIVGVALWLKYHQAIPLLFAASCLIGELWWRNKYFLELLPDGLKYGPEPIPWDNVARYTTWGPIGIPWTPIKLEGINLYLKSGQTFTIYSKAPGYAMLLQRLQTKQFPPLPEAVWYSYPARPIRTLRYGLAFLFALVYMVIYAIAQLVLIVGVVVLAYFTYQKGALLYKKQGKSWLPERIWIAIIAALCGLVLLALLIFLLNKIPIIGWLLGIIVAIFMYLFNFVMSMFDWLPFILGFVPAALLIWYPWQPAPLALISDSLLRGKKAAYPLRHLRTERTSSKFFVLKIWELIFANGEVAVFPLLEDLENFKKKLQGNWDEVQKRYYGKPFTEEEAKVLTPLEEAKNLFSTNVKLHS